MSRSDDGGGNACAYLVDRHLEEGRGDRIALRAGERRLAYRELWAQSARAAGVFAARGVTHGDRVALLLPDGVTFVVSFLGLLRLGAVPIPLNERLSAHDVTRIVDDCRPAGAVASGTNAERLADAAHRPPPERVWIAGSTHTEAMRSFDAEVGDAEPRTTAISVGDDDLAAILYTSGTTGAPKGAVYVHRGLRESIQGCFEAPFALTRDDVCFSTASLSFAYGLYALLHALAVGAAAILDDSPRMPHLVLECLRTESPSVLFSTPRVYTDLVALAEEHQDHELRGLRMCISSGEPVPERLFERWSRRFGLELLDVVGATETLRPFLVPDPANPRPVPDHRPSPGCDVDVRDEHGRAVTEGAVFVRTTCNAPQYWNSESETATTMQGGWVRTGDVAVRRGSGRFTLLGRSDGIAKVRGQKLVAGEIERCLREHAAVDDCALVIATGLDELATPVAFVETDAGDDAALPRALRRHCRSRLTPHKVPARVVVVDALPRTANGKVARGRLRDAANELVRAPAPVGRP